MGACEQAYGEISEEIEMAQLNSLGGSVETIALASISGILLATAYRSEQPLVRGALIVGSGLLAGKAVRALERYGDQRGKEALLAEELKSLGALVYGNPSDSDREAPHLVA